MNDIETFDLSFSYGKRKVLNGISIAVEQGAIYGLLGRNGSGKSTLLKLLLGQLPATKNRVAYFGNTKFDHNLFYQIGCLIESPALYGFLTVYEHLEMLDILFAKGNKRIESVLATVGLSQEKDKAARKLSTGQKQRLGIAMAIFRDPQILIIDEPLNGLDSIGIIDMRDLLLQLHQEGKTILMSSHIISELEKLCTHVGIIENGRLIFQGSITQTDNQTLESFYLNTLSDNV